MLKARFLALCLSALTPLVVTSLAPSVLAGQNAGSTSGNNPTGGSQTVFSIPITISAPGTVGGFQPVSGNIIITASSTPGGPPTVTLPATIAAALNTAGSNAVITFSTGSLSQQQIVALVSALSLTVASNTNSTVAGGIIVEVQSSTGATTSSSVANTFGAAITALATQLAALPAGGVVTLQVGNVRVVISPSDAAGLTQ